MSWKEFLEEVANAYGLLGDEKRTFLEKFPDENANQINAKIASNLNLSQASLDRHLKAIYEIFAQNCSGLDSDKKGKFKILYSWLKQQYAQYQITEQIPGLPIVSKTSFINWREICYAMLQKRKLRQLAVESLGRIDPSNLQAIADLVELICTPENLFSPRQAAWSLQSILKYPQMVGVIAALKKYLSDKTYENDFIRFDACYTVVWHCAQTLSYPEFYQAWTRS